MERIRRKAWANTYTYARTAMERDARSRANGASGSSHTQIHYTNYIWWGNVCVCWLSLVHTMCISAGTHTRTHRQAQQSNKKGGAWNILSGMISVFFFFPSTDYCSVSIKSSRKLSLMSLYVQVGVDVCAYLRRVCCLYARSSFCLFVWLLSHEITRDAFEYTWCLYCVWLFPFYMENIVWLHIWSILIWHKHTINEQSDGAKLSVYECMCACVSEWVNVYGFILCW